MSGGLFKFAASLTRIGPRFEEVTHANFDAF